MTEYQLQLGYPGVVKSVTIHGQNISIPISADNTDYETFKYEIENDQALLYDVDDNLMSPEAAKAYVATLP